MKNSLLACMLVLSVSTSAQFGNVSVGAIIPKEADAIFNASFSGGITLGEYLNIGASFGYYKFKGGDKPVIPIGVEVSAINKKSDKVSPYAILGVYYPAYNLQNNTTGPGYIINIKVNGVFQWKAGAGIGFPIYKEKKLVLAAGITPVKIKVESKTTIYGGGQPTRNTSSNTSSTTDMYFITLGFLF